MTHQEIMDRCMALVGQVDGILVQRPRRSGQMVMVCSQTEAEIFGLLQEVATLIAAANDMDEPSVPLNIVWNESMNSVSNWYQDQSAEYHRTQEFLARYHAN